LVVSKAVFGFEGCLCWSVTQFFLRFWLILLISWVNFGDLNAHICEIDPYDCPTLLFILNSINTYSSLISWLSHLFGLNVRALYEKVINIWIMITWAPSGLANLEALSYCALRTSITLVSLNRLSLNCRLNSHQWLTCPCT
jgi:hypothetical protein